MGYESGVEIVSEAAPGVRFVVDRMSFGRRLELIRQLKGWLGKLEFVTAGPEGPEREAEAALLAGEIDRIYLRWGLRGVTGIEIDGEPVTPESLVEKGPEALVKEVLRAIRREAGLSEAERKNCESPSISCEETRPDGSATIAAA
ncbi:MAG: hypothetical protein HY238_04355 [Acidobacteria bacterium]|nr:hypothetical protein [Acidobacteriota bacterium]